MLTLEHVSKKYKEQRVLQDINFSLDEKEFISIIGKSGVGKTTLLSIMAGLISPDGGKIVFSGKDITEYSEEQLSEFRLNNIGIVFQDFKLIASLSVFDNILLAIYPRRDIDREEKKRRILDLIEQVGLMGKQNSTVNNLSGGEMQRVAIARSLVNQPKLILADEPTGNLDENTSGQILDLFKELHTRLSTTFIIVTHEKDIAKKTQKTYQLSQDGLRHIVL
jgi:ABC-type lipoprotein export system ATPase subunit